MLVRFQTTFFFFFPPILLPNNGFVSFLKRFVGGNGKRHWLLHPVKESNLQLFALISIWISSKVSFINYLHPISYRTSLGKLDTLQIYISEPLSVKTLKSLGDRIITEQHFTLRDYIEAVSFFSLKLGQYLVSSMHCEVVHETCYRKLCFCR